MCTVQLHNFLKSYSFVLNPELIHNWSIFFISDTLVFCLFNWMCFVLWSTPFIDSEETLLINCGNNCWMVWQWKHLSSLSSPLSILSAQPFLFPLLFLLLPFSSLLFFHSQTKISQMVCVYTANNLILAKALSYTAASIIRNVSLGANGFSLIWLLPVIKFLNS